VPSRSAAFAGLLWDALVRRVADVLDRALRNGLSDEIMDLVAVTREPLADRRDHDQQA
jgi:hypothetical protein